MVKPAAHTNDCLLFYIGLIEIYNLYDEMSVNNNNVNRI